MEQFYTIITPLFASQVVYEWEEKRQKGRAYIAQVLGKNPPNTWEEFSSFAVVVVVVVVMISWKAKDSDEVCI